MRFVLVPPFSPQCSIYPVFLEIIEITQVEKVERQSHSLMRGRLSIRGQTMLGTEPLVRI